MAAPALATAFVNIVPGTAALENYLKGGGLEKQASGAGDKAGKSFAGGFSGAVKKLIGPAVLTAFGAFVTSAVKGASSLSAEFEGVNQVFGKSAAAVQTFAKNAATSAGLTETAALQAAKNLGVFAGSAGLSSDASAKFSTDLVQLAGDLGSFNDVPTADALAAIQSGLMGQAEPLRKFGVFLTDSKLKAEAMAQGIYDGNGALNDQQKMLASYGVIMKSTTLQQGDFVKYANDFGNAQKSMTSNFQNMQATIGTSLLPVLGQLMAGLNPVVTALGPVLFNVFQKLIPLFELVTKTIIKLIPALDPVIGAFGMLVDVVVKIMEIALPPLLEVFNAFLPVLKPLMGLFMALVQAVLPPLAELISKVLVPVLMFLVDILNKYLIPYWAALAKLFGGALSIAVNVVVGAFQWLVKVLKPVWDFVKPIIEGFMALAGMKPVKISATITADRTERLAGGTTGAGAAGLPGAIDFSKVNVGGSKGASKSAKATAKAVEKLIKDTNKKITSAQDKFAKAKAAAAAVYAKAVAKAETVYAEQVTKLTTKRDAGLAQAAKDHAANIESINKDFTNRLADVVQQSKDRLRNAFESVASIDVGKTFADLGTKNVDSLLAVLKKKLSQAKDLVLQAGALASAGFSQTFIEQVTAQGPEAGTAMAEAILRATPESQAELRALFAESEITAAHGMDNLTNTLYDKQGLATEALKTLYTQTQADLATALAAEAKAYAEKQTEILASFDAGMAEAEKTRVDAIAAAQADLEDALQKATDEFNAAMAEIAKDFNDKLKDFTGKLAGYAKQISGIKGDIASAIKLAQTPITVTVNTIVQTTQQYTAAGKPKLARGGLISTPTTALIGEAGPEVVTPLSDLERMLGLSGKSSGNTLIYNAAPNKSLDAEQELRMAMTRAKAVGAW